MFFEIRVNSRTCRAPNVSASSRSTTVKYEDGADIEHRVRARRPGRFRRGSPTRGPAWSRSHLVHQQRHEQRDGDGREHRGDSDEMG